MGKVIKKMMLKKETKKASTKDHQQDLSIQAQSLGIRKKAKTHKGKKFLEEREPKLDENLKSAIFVKGKKSSQVINNLLRELHIVRGSTPNKMFLRKTHNILPFEDA